MIAISRILFPVDFSDQCSGMIPHVKGFATKYGAEIRLLHVVNPVYLIAETGISGLGIVPRPEWLIAQEADRLNDFSTKEFQGFSVSPLFYEGDPEAQIVAAAQDVQLVVMPTHGYGTFRRFLLGSLTVALH
jgi:nucleotide-binding universal stress UspA family protein